MQSDLVKDFLSSVSESESKLYGVRDYCGLAAQDMVFWAWRNRKVILYRVSGEIKSDVVVHDPEDFTQQMRKEFKLSGLNFNCAQDRRKWIEENEKYSQEWRWVPHYWLVDEAGTIHDPSGYQQLVLTGMASDMGVDRYRAKSEKVLLLDIPKKEEQHQRLKWRF